MSDISFLCGLGNPGGKYRSTRHNLGFDTLDLLARRRKLEWKNRRDTALVSRWSVAGRDIVLIKPLTYMNLSAQALELFPSISGESLLVICDDINLPLGRLRIREGGGSGGHRGLESISGYLATDRYPRLRMGAGPSPDGEEWSDFVLSPFTAIEKPLAEKMVEEGVDAIEFVVREGIEAAQREFNRRMGGQ
ncbi:MAG: aminoacyl-tRNA hydrolase [Candidatus Krumholzibacteriota bacterium]|nr:aminoacyl-tRNA hydrolase [Candidatus Krumholzibacteriota bacterium]